MNKNDLYGNCAHHLWSAPAGAIDILQPTVHVSREDKETSILKNRVMDAPLEIDLVDCDFYLHLSLA